MTTEVENEITSIYLYELENRFEEYINERYTEHHFPYIVGNQTVSVKPYEILKKAEPIVYDNALYEYALSLKEEEGIEVLGYNDNE